MLLRTIRQNFTRLGRVGYCLLLGLVDDFAIVGALDTVESLLPGLETRLATFFEQGALKSTVDRSS